MKGKKLLNIVKQIHSPVFVLEGYDKAIIGFDVMSRKLIYSVKKSIKIIDKRDDILSREESSEDYFYTTVFSNKQIIESVIFNEDYLIIKEFKNERFRND